MAYPNIITERLELRAPVISDGFELQNFESRNQAHLSPWETLSSDSIESRLQNWMREIEEGRAIRYILFHRTDTQHRIIGMCNFTQIFRGFFQACFLGYKIDQSHQGQGLMKEAIGASLFYIFNDLKLHRVMANYMPSNSRSANLLGRLGFEIEGTAKSYLLINGHWEDHILTSKINPEGRS